MRALRGHPDGHLARAGIVARDGATRLHGVGDEALVVKALAHHDVGALDRGVGGGPVAGRPVHADIVGRLVVELRRSIRHGLFLIDHGRQGPVVDRDEIEGVVGDVGVLGHHRGHAVADVAHPVHGQHAVWGNVVLHAAGREGARERVDRIAQIGAGDHVDHAGEGPRRGSVDVVDAGVGVGAAQDGHVRHAGELDVVEVLAVACDQARVFLALDARADELWRHTRRLCDSHVTPPVSSDE